ncbi:hypothetical protein SEA_WEST99_56 [Mycobacterium phage West99]|uniref:Uncharacterized protein n=11 Tax=Rosebushvirus TaxID=1982900 RepID=A0A120HUL7_9CAUD|nr:hypothetical protein FPF50_gp57 [Mycobacterium phage TA17A]AEN79579.1 hypothetical protein ARBITER_55 [Mycobacterium phage Arbiter]AIK68830.1 hypothetical protein PBI_LIZLEMON_56 [Mycobacterium phage LizLemon]AMB17370.1 hypothetical protein SEA_GLASS_56 [Mycobacterium phage Glass]AUX82264.1 hypothetical protein SEA_ITSYBITSY1_56 [Mycobacterium phage ItsyBitsy1]AVO21903.1 hypothetical protein SEA_KHETH_56 [Mycobacterium phage Kheth]AVR76551.1 hypothetical protein SEA_BOYLE_56 [Mycobacterium
MSKYREKRAAHSAPHCAVPDCTAPGARLVRTPDGGVDWFCVGHADDPPTADPTA